MMQKKFTNEAKDSSLNARLKRHLPLILIGGALSSTLWIGRISKETREQVSQITNITNVPERDYSGNSSNDIPRIHEIDSSDISPAVSEEHQTGPETLEVPSPSVTDWLDESDLRSFVQSLENVERRLNALERLVKMNNLQKTKELLETFPTLRAPLGKTLPKYEHHLKCQAHLLKLETILISIRSQLSPLEKQRIWESISFYLLSMNLLNLLEQSDDRIQALRDLLQ
jgi:hypothetical protein